jgi:sugar O-acyltransferase (sialic acid O-acetyltransferase NeuD family)
MKEMKLILLGAGDLSREILAAALELKPDWPGGDISWKPVAFIDEDPGKIGQNFENLPVIAYDELKRFNPSDVSFICGVGDPTSRVNMIMHLLQAFPRASFATIIHRSAVIMGGTAVAEGVYIGPHATVAIGCRVEAHVVLNFNVSIGHDCLIHSYAVVSPGCLISGRTEIGEKSFLGSGAITYPGIKIGVNCSISAGVSVARHLANDKSLIIKPNTMVIPRGSENEQVPRRNKWVT